IGLVSVPGESPCLETRFDPLGQEISMLLRHTFILAAALLPAAPMAARAQAPLELDRALMLAQERSRQLAAQDAAVGAAREMAAAAGQRPDPVLKAGINNLPVN